MSNKSNTSNNNIKKDSLPKSIDPLDKLSNDGLRYLEEISGDIDIVSKMERRAKEQLQKNRSRSHKSSETPLNSEEGDHSSPDHWQNSEMIAGQDKLQPAFIGSREIALIF